MRFHRLLFRPFSHLCALTVVAFSLPSVSRAHVGSPNVYFQGYAGPYRLVVMVRTPQMIPGIAEIEIRSDQPGIRQIKLTPLFIVGAGSKYPPPPDVLTPTAGAPQFFTGKIWLMESGSWQVRIEADGARGSGTTAVPVPAAARSTLPMQKVLGALLFGLMLLLVGAIVSIAGAARREALLPPGEQPGRQHKAGARWVMAGALAALIGVLVFGNWWWDTAAAAKMAQMIYKPPKMAISLTGNKLLLRMGESDWHSRRPETVMTALIPDHSHLMHLFLIRVPQMDRFYHLHPAQTDPQSFAENLPSVVAGHYKVFADIVRASGFPDTMVAGVDIPETPPPSTPGDADDSEASAAPIAQHAADTLIAPLADGTRMVWERDAGTSVSNRLLSFRFRVEDARGKPVTDLEPYMGMTAHAVLVSSDMSVFAHVHPDGSVPMAALMLADASLGVSTTRQRNSVTGMAMGAMPSIGSMSNAPLPAEISFPYGFPKAGTYRIFVQIKRHGAVETGVFDANAN